MIRILIFALLAATCHAANTNKVDKAEKEKKTEHAENKIVKKSRDKGSNAPWKTEKEYTLMFKNNRKARPKK
jgi:hypothetical protein